MTLLYVVYPCRPEVGPVVTCVRDCVGQLIVVFSFVVLVARNEVFLYGSCVRATLLYPFADTCFLTSATAAPIPAILAALPPRRQPAPLGDRSPLIVPDELLHFPANVRRGDLRRPGGVISTHSLGCRQLGRCQEPAWIARSADRTARLARGNPRRRGSDPA